MTRRPVRNVGASVLTVIDDHARPIGTFGIPCDTSARRDDSCGSIRIDENVGI